MMALYTEDYHANEGTYAGDVPQAGVVWMVQSFDYRAVHDVYVHGVFASLGSARRYVQGHIQFTHCMDYDGISELWVWWQGTVYARMFISRCEVQA